MADLLVEMAWVPERLREKVGGAFGFDDREIKGNLERFEGSSRRPRDGRRAG